MSNFSQPGGDYKNLGDNFTWGCLSKDPVFWFVNAFSNNLNSIWKFSPTIVGYTALKANLTNIQERDKALHNVHCGIKLPPFQKTTASFLPAPSPPPRKLGTLPARPPPPPFLGNPSLYIGLSWHSLKVTHFSANAKNIKVFFPSLLANPLKVTKFLVKILQRKCRWG